MRTTKVILMAGAALVLGLLGGQGATAQADNAGDQASADYSAALEAAFGPGYWNGRFEERDEAGQVAVSDDTPSCIKPGEAGGFAAGITQALTTLRTLGTCTSTSGGAGSLNFTLSCKGANGGQIDYVSVGTYTPGKAADLHVSIGAPGKSRSMHVTTFKVSDTCPQ